MNSEFFDALEMLEKEKGIKKSYMLEKVQAALTSAFKKDFGSENVIIELNDEKKEVKMYAAKEVVEEVENPSTQISLEDAQLIAKKYGVGDTVNIEIKPKNFGRIATGAAKQVIIQGIREAERSMVYDQFADNEHQVLTATVNKIDPKNGNATVEIKKTETLLLKSEQIPGEVLRENQRIKVYVIEVKRATKGPVVAVSRTHPGLVKHLFEREVPEIYDGTVEIKSVSREAGSRTKIAVWS
ncbi:MAG: S1 RNA-binding domain-containing protein, partial [Clostridia bacterium]|nr:S1 RNA-binding domain-containing protein [Clostridia bacterium]